VGTLQEQEVDVMRRILYIILILVALIAAVNADPLMTYDWETTNVTYPIVEDTTNDFNGLLANVNIIDTDCISGQCADIDGVNSYIITGINTTELNEGNWAVSFWAKVESFSIENNGLVGCMDESNQGFGVFINPTARIWISSTDTSVDTGVTIDVDDWNFYTFSMNTEGTDTRYLYINGSLVYNSTGVYENCNYNLSIGNLYSGIYNNQGINGIIDSVYFHDIVGDDEIWGELFNDQFCTPNWTCDGYAACLPNNTQECNSVLDLNTCGDTYGGDYSEFEPQVCVYNAGFDYDLEDTPAITGDAIGRFGAGLASVSTILGIVLGIGAAVGVGVGIRNYVRGRK
jgi:hypothetical protein